MSHSSTRTVVREIPAPIPAWPDRPTRTASRIPWLSVVTFLAGLVTYFWALIYTYSIVGIGVAVFLIVLAMVFNVAWTLNQLGDSPTEALLSDVALPSESSPQALPSSELTESSHVDTH